MPRNVTPVDSIEVGADAKFEKRWQLIQQCVWMALSLLVLAGLSDLLGGNPLAKSHLKVADASVEYERFARLPTPATIKIIVPPAPQEFTFALNRSETQNDIQHAVVERNGSVSVLKKPEIEEDESNAQAQR